MDSFRLLLTYYNPHDKLWDGTSKQAPATFEFAVDKLSETRTEPVSDATQFGLINVTYTISIHGGNV